MDIWDMYERRMVRPGCQIRNARIESEREALRRRMLESPSTHLVKTPEHDEQFISIAHTEDRSEKKIFALPGDHLHHGGLIKFHDAMWLVTEVDIDNDVYEKGLMHRCNYILRWKNREGRIIEKWCVVEDGTKYLVGERYEQIMATGDARIAVTVGKDDDTNGLERGMRFIIDDLDAEHPLVYEITKPNKLFNVYDGKGVFRFIMSETVLTDNDDVQLRIADYVRIAPPQEVYPDYPEEETWDEEMEIPEDGQSHNKSDKKEVWL